MRSNNFKTSLKNSSSDQALIAEFWNKIYRKSIKNRKTKNNLLPLQRVEPFHKLRLPSLTKTQIFWLKSNAWRHRTNHTCLLLPPLFPTIYHSHTMIWLIESCLSYRHNATRLRWIQSLRTNSNIYAFITVIVYKWHKINHCDTTLFSNLCLGTNCICLGVEAICNEFMARKY